ncbi:inactive non-canonical poly(a) RNA polymerase protein trf4-2-related [Anaeramoeba flamelloides]|uniref:Inactive non-canonical poly(A) RNA polymerase protein trf4-2-related n=1 Tax=Anaeramoeba flamelloides TaxID=1746091 RepID=A0AAV8ABD4_9EUKA|nr:inactive non-canonical poly(a) RNA polymerase protein trf4-2-related [Anaeramoeba flamelloides]
MEILFPDFWTMLWDYGIYLYKNVSQIKMFRPKVIEAEYLNSVIVTNEKFCKRRGKLYMNYIHSIFLQNSIYLYPEKKKQKNQKKNQNNNLPNKTSPITQDSNLQKDLTTAQPISTTNTSTSTNTNTNTNSNVNQTQTQATTTPRSRIKKQNRFFLSTFWHSIFGVAHQPNFTKISKLVSSILQPSQIQRNAQTKTETETETISQTTRRSSRRRSTRSKTKNLMELQSLSNFETNLNTLNSQKLNFSSHESPRIARTIGVLGFQIIKTLQNSTTKRENISTFSGFSRQRVCTVITIYSAINLVKENSKTGVISWNKKQARSITDFDIYSKRVIKLRELKRRFGIKLFQLAIQFHQKNNRLNQNRNFIDTSEMILDLIFGKLSEIGLNYKQLTSSNIQNEIPEKTNKMQRELEETIKFFQNQSKIFKLFGKKNNNKNTLNINQKSPKIKLINTIQINKNNLIIDQTQKNNNSNISINGNNSSSSSVSNNNSNNNNNNNNNNNGHDDDEDDDDDDNNNNNNQKNKIMKNNGIKKINENTNLFLNMDKPANNVKTRIKIKKIKAKKNTRKKINHNKTLNPKIKKEMIKKKVNRSPTKVESIYDNFIFKTQHTNNNININTSRNINSININQKNQINNNINNNNHNHNNTLPNNFNNNLNNQINKNMILNQNNPKLYLTSPNFNFLPTPILTQTPTQSQTLTPTLASTIYQMPSPLPMPLPQPIKEQKKSINGSTTPKSSFKTFPLNNTNQVPKSNYLKNEKKYPNYNSPTLQTRQTPRTLGEIAPLPNRKYDMNYQRMGISPQIMPTPSNLSFDTQSPMLSPFFPTLSPSPQINPSPINTFFPTITFLPIIQLDQTQQQQYLQQQIKQQQQQIKQQQQQIKQQRQKMKQLHPQLQRQQPQMQPQIQQQQPQMQQQQQRTQNTHFQQLLQQEYSFPSFPFFNRSTAFPPKFPIQNIQSQNVKLDPKKTKKDDQK